MKAFDTNQAVPVFNDVNGFYDVALSKYRTRFLSPWFSEGMISLVHWILICHLAIQLCNDDTMSLSCLALRVCDSFLYQPDVLENRLVAHHIILHFIKAPIKTINIPEGKMFILFRIIRRNLVGFYRYHST